ncbi:MAG: Uncharacterized protein XD63_1296 [Thermoanaerobacterales bacterium 50_218]|nr:MAG: Uncharacterized protein XD63_1296 [Thermoanaerobacterales bacterium 50_218]HAA90057.1 hypothetical protein [Peptococcaceae bacterium]
MRKNKALEEWKTKKFGRVITEEELQRRTSEVWPYKYFNPGRPVEPSKVDEIMKGIIDTHIHGAPMGAWLAGRPPMTATCIKASEAGIRALVFKDHNCWTHHAATVIAELLEELKKEKEAQGKEFTPVEVYGGVTLNYSVGGLNPKMVQTALGYGRCKEIWLPSLDAWHQRAAMGLEGGIYVADGEDLVPEMIEILEILADYNNNTKGERCALAACHVSNEEKVAILKYIKKKGMDVDVIIDHCTQELTIVTPEEAKEMIDLGAYLQFCECSCIPWPGMQDWVVAFDYSMNLIKELIKEKGPDHLVLATDAGQPGNEPVTGWWHFLRILMSQGVDEADINVMAKEVPAKLIGLS